VQHAHACEFELDGPVAFQRWVGAYATTQTLMTAQQLGMPMTANVAFGAADVGRIASLRLLFTEEHRANWGEKFEAGTMRSAAAAGQLQACMYLHSAGCKLGVVAVAAAAAHGHIELLRWQLQHCTLQPEHCATACGVALTSRRCRSVLPVLQLLLDASEWTEPPLTEMLQVAGLNSELEAARLLRQRGSQWPRLPYSQPWPDDAAAWAKQQGCTAPITLLELTEGLQKWWAAERAQRQAWELESGELAQMTLHS
jgi:hypothetical protein